MINAKIISKLLRAPKIRKILSLSAFSDTSFLICFINKDNTFTVGVIDDTSNAIELKNSVSYLSKSAALINHSIILNEKIKHTYDL